MVIGANILVSGVVQGVGFRYYVWEQAMHLRLKGFVKNNHDGTVEIEVEGTRFLIDEFLKRLKIGSRSSKVTDIKVKWKDHKNQFKTFDIR